MKKIFISAAISLSLLGGVSNAEGRFVSENTTIKDIISTKNKNIQKLFSVNPELLTTSEKLEEDIELEQMLIEKFDEKFVKNKSQYTPEEYNHMMNSYFVDALKTNKGNLADFILYKSGALIDVNFKQSENPTLTPLMATTTAMNADGGDIEYFIKLIEMGADYKEITTNYNIPLMSLAATVDNYKIVLYLAMLGENVMHLDDLDYYPLDYAVRNDAHRTTVILTDLITQYKNEIEKRNN